jgi:hypothetical protein
MTRSYRIAGRWCEERFTLSFSTSRVSFWTWLDGPLRPNPDSLPRHEGFGVRAARVVYVAREIRARAAVDGVLFVYREEVTPAPALDLFAREDWPNVFDYPPPRRYRARSEQAQPRRRTLDGVTHLHLLHAAECNSTARDFSPPADVRRPDARNFPAMNPRAAVFPLCTAAKFRPEETPS